VVALLTREEEINLFLPVASTIVVLSDQYYRIKMHIMTLILLKVKNKERA
jgi:hypothetical protein